MKSFTGWLAGLGLAAILNLPAQAQIAVAPGVGGIGAFGGVGVRPSGPVIGGYGVSTVPGGNPFFGTGSLSTSPYAGPYGLSTVPYTGGYIPPYAQPYYDIGLLSRLDPYSGYLQGLAAVTSATGQYQKDIQQARLLREESRRSAYDTMKKRVQFEAWFESQKYLGTQALLDRQKAADLDRARRSASEGEIASGLALNNLLRSILDTATKTSLPSEGEDLAETMLTRINVTPRSAAGNAALLRDGGKLTWPAGLREPAFNEVRDLFSRKFVDAVELAKGGKDIPATLRKEIDENYEVLRTKLTENYEDIGATEFVTAKRYLAQLRDAISTLRDPNVKKYLDNTWILRGQKVKQLVERMRADGLVFNAAAPGDEPAYQTLYYALRQYEASLGSGR